jgi:hypothetical protein
MLKIKIIIVLSLIFPCISYALEDHTSVTECSKSKRNYSDILSPVCKKTINLYNYLQYQDGESLYLDKKSFMDHYANDIIMSDGAIDNNEISIVMFTINKEHNKAKNLYSNSDIRVYPLDENIKKTSYYNNFDRFNGDKVNINFEVSGGDYVVKFDILDFNLNRKKMAASISPKYFKKNVDLDLLKSDWIEIYSNDNKIVYVKSFESVRSSVLRSSYQDSDNTDIYNYYKLNGSPYGKSLFFSKKDDFINNLEGLIIENDLDVSNNEEQIYLLAVGSDSYHGYAGRNNVLNFTDDLYIWDLPYNREIEFGRFDNRDYKINLDYKDGVIDIKFNYLNEYSYDDFDSLKWNYISEDYKGLKVNNPAIISDINYSYSGLTKKLKKMKMIIRVPNKRKDGYIEIYAIVIKNRGF